MAGRTDSAAQLRDLGGVSGALALLEAAGTSGDVRESAVLALANTTQRDDDVCVSIGAVPRDALARFIRHLTGEHAVRK